jgi:hypothetical protein
MLGDKDDIDAVDREDDFEDTLEMETQSNSVQSANVGDGSVELNVEDIIAELEADADKQPQSNEPDPRKRLERLLEERRAARELEDIDGFALDET